jgi:adenylosuccinate synthase
MSGTNIAWTRVNHVGDKIVKARLAYEDIMVVDNTPEFIADGIDNQHKDVLLEGTQGSGLSLTHGDWPYVTSTDTNAAQLLVDSGISPGRLSEVILVTRTFPIRVAGNSGPMHDEISFEDLEQEPEFTTVTKKMRRIGRFDWELFHKAVLLNGPWPMVALTFLDYLFPEDKGVTTWNELSASAHDFMEELEDKSKSSVILIGTGPDSMARYPGLKL